MTLSGAGTRTRRTLKSLTSYLMAPVGLLGLLLVIFLRYGPLGINPTDQGYILAQSYAILHGAIPHLGIISPRPLGSAFLHTIDFLIPLPLVEADRLVGLTELVAYCMFCSWLIFSTAPHRWRLWQLLVTASSVLISMNAFAMEAVHTIDGIFFISVGYVLLSSGISGHHNLRLFLGCIALGMAAIMKQNFVIGPLSAVAFLIVLASRNHYLARHDLRREYWGGVTQIIAAAFCTMIPAGAYVLAVYFLGAYQATQRQILDAAAPIYLDLYQTMIRDKAWIPVGLFIALTAITRMGDDHLRDRVANSLFLMTSIGSRVAATGLVVYTALHQGLQEGNEWSTELFVICAVALGLDMVSKNFTDAPRLVAILVLAYATSLAWGLPAPDLVGGPLAVATVIIIWRRAPRIPIVFSRFGPALLSLGALIPTAAVFNHARLTDIYLDESASHLTVSLNRIEPAFGFVRTNPRTAQYFRDIKLCVTRYPAEQVAVLPDNPIVYPVYGLKDAFPISWPYPSEYAGFSPQIVNTARLLKRDGDYLVLFQTQAADGLASIPIDQATSASQPFSYDAALTDKLLQILGRDGTCGPFIVSYAAKGFGGLSTSVG